MIDGIGIYGTALFYAFSGAFFGMALLFFGYFFWKKQLSYDEAAKYQMLEEKE